MAPEAPSADSERQMATVHRNECGTQIIPFCMCRGRMARDPYHRVKVDPDSMPGALA